MAAPRQPDPPRENYTHGYDGRLYQMHAARTAEREGAFFLPHGRQGLRLLDMGCGSGSMTVGLAASVASGEAVGIDVEPTVIERARRRAADDGIPNVFFEVGSAYALPFPDGAFDAVSAHTLLQHVRDPLRVLREARRVLKPGGVIGLREGDWGTWVIAPANEALEQAIALYLRLWEHNGGNPRVGRLHRTLLHDARFTRSESSGTTMTAGTPAATQAFAGIAADMVASSSFGEPVAALGWTEKGALDALAHRCRAWGDEPGAFSTMVMCQTVGWRD
jgi:ubiquinone/menaquinone biosynthesis C-methylase UbiE